MIVFQITEDVFKTQPLFIIGCSWDDLVAYCARRFPKLDLGARPSAFVAGTMMTLGGPPWRLIWTNKVDLPMVLHEVFHLTTRILQDKGVPPICAKLDDGVNNGDEAAAYLFEFFATRVFKQLRVKVGRKR